MYKGLYTFFKPVPDHAPTLVLQHQVVHLCPVLGDHLGPWLNHLGIHSGSEDPCMGHAHQVPTNKTTGQLCMEVPWGGNTSDKILLQLRCRRLNTYWDKELLDLLHGMSHTQIGLWYGCHHLDEHMQLHGQVSIFGLTTLSQLFLLMKILNANDNIQNMNHRNNVEQLPFNNAARKTLYKPYFCPSWNLYPELKSWPQSPPAVSWLCCPEVPKAYQQSWPVQNLVKLQHRESVLMLLPWEKMQASVQSAPK